MIESRNDRSDTSVRSDQNDRQEYELGETFALKADAADPLAKFRDQFHFPQSATGEDMIYLSGNSLGLQPRRTKEFVEQELNDWAKLGVKGHVHARNPWLPYHENLTQQTAHLVGAKPIEVVVMNTLTVNLHLMMVSFYQPTQKRFKILIEKGAFPSDQYAVASQARFHGFNPQEALIEIAPREGEDTIRNEDILNCIEEKGSSIALILMGSVNYLTGQAFDIQAITAAGHAHGCKVGFDLAHGAGNLHLRLHDWGPDFAVWCGYKYLNGGPGSLSGCFIHERHSMLPSLPRFAGWWGHDKNTRFQMSSHFNPIPGAEGWQLSNPPILQLAALRASMEIFEEAGMERIRSKSIRLTGYLEFLLNQLPSNLCTIITPRDPNKRGAQLSLRIGPPGGRGGQNGQSGQQTGMPQEVVSRWSEAGIVCDFREPDIIRVAPTALYNRYIDVYRFVKNLEQYATGI